MCSYSSTVCRPAVLQAISELPAALNLWSSKHWHLKLFHKSGEGDCLPGPSLDLENKRTIVIRQREAARREWFDNRPSRFSRLLLPRLESKAEPGRDHTTPCLTIRCSITLALHSTTRHYRAHHCTAPRNHSPKKVLDTTHFTSPPLNTTTCHYHSTLTVVFPS